MFEDGKISSEIDYSSLNSLCEIFETLDINSLSEDHKMNYLSDNNTFVIDDFNNLPNKIVDPDHIINLQRCKSYIDGNSYFNKINILTTHNIHLYRILPIVLITSKNYKSSILLIYRDKPNIRRYKNYLNSSCSSTFSKNIHCKENYNLYTGEK
ncbi:hypothetical protein U3516DRAFT_790612 [Neocallimastix sp. 'constans']